MKHSILFTLLILIFFSSDLIPADRKEIVADRNEFGGETIEYSKDDFSIQTIYLDADGNKAKEEIIYTSDYPIDNNLTRMITHFYFGKKVKEELIFNASFSRRTLIRKTVHNYNRNTGELINSENYFVKPFEGYNVIFSKNGKKSKIEWHYPDTTDGIIKNVNFLNEDEKIIRTESYFAEKTAREKGYYKRVYYSNYNLNRYVRKSRQEWYFTKEYGQQNQGIHKKVELFHYSLGKPVKIETVYYDQDGQYLGN